jgi:predicted adenylyl cyclase CyaB
MRNIEIKARISDLEKTREIAEKIDGVHLDGTFEQIDTYFQVPTGRLKLREVVGTRTWSELIRYQRPDQTGPKGSEYSLTAVIDPVSMREVLTGALGVLVEVRKRRTVFLWQTVRIHLDDVDSLGCFLEFEVVLNDDIDDSAGQVIAENLLDHFGIADNDLLAVSYSDLVMQQ